MSNDPINLSAFLPLVLPYAPGCADLVATYNLRLAAIEFCEKTRCWRYNTEEEVDDAQPLISIPEFSTVSAFEYAYFEGQKLTPAALVDIEAMGLSEEGTPQYITQEAPNTLRLAPFAEGTLKIGLFLKPRMGSAYAANADGAMENSYDRVPTFMYFSHAEALASGALSRLLTQPKTPYFNPDLAAYHAVKFKGAINDAMGQSLSGDQRAPIRSKTSWF